MRVRTPLELGLLIRDRRRQLKLSQSGLASKAGVGRQWLVAVEHGKARAELGLVLRTLAALDLSIAIETAPQTGAADIDAVVDAAREHGG